jgi:uncharacterized Zn finger protein
MIRRGAHSWWARRWIEALEALGWEARLARGRTYARAGNVRSIDIQPGRVTARVKGSRPQPYTVRIELPALSDDDWARVVEGLAGQARYAASLLAGEMPPNVDELFTEQGAHLFPRSEAELRTECSCPDWANPCKHVAAVHYVLGNELDRDPFMLFRLRGRGRDAVLAALRARRTTGEAAEGPPAPDDPQPPTPNPQDAPLEAQLDRFWTIGDELAELRFAVEPPRVEAAVLKRLGPPATPEGDLPTADLARAYRLISDQALRAAYESGEG